MCARWMLDYLSLGLLSLSAVVEGRFPSHGTPATTPAAAAAAAMLSAWSAGTGRQPQQQQLVPDRPLSPPFSTTCQLQIANYLPPASHSPPPSGTIRYAPSMPHIASVFVGREDDMRRSFVRPSRNLSACTSLTQPSIVTEPSPRLGAAQRGTSNCAADGRPHKSFMIKFLVDAASATAPSSCGGRGALTATARAPSSVEPTAAVRCATVVRQR